MGLLRSFAKKVVGAAKAVQEEAKHPGVPPAHKASENPFHEPPAAKVAPKVAPPKEAADGRTEKPWYLQGDTEGWDETDPK